MSDKEVKSETQEQKCNCEDCKCKCECEDCKNGHCEKCGCAQCKDAEGKQCKCEDCKESNCEECNYEECKCGVEDCEECNCEECDCKDCENGDWEKMINELANEKQARINLLAEFVNYKKRNEAEKAEFVTYANGNILKQVIEIVDDFDRALKEIDKKDKVVVDGVKMIHKKMMSIISINGLELLDIKEGDDFSPLTMEAVTTIKVDDEKKHNKVVEVLQKGYKYRQTGKTFKNAVVVIGKKQ